jgi:hypothetical protein
VAAALPAGAGRAICGYLLQRALRSQAIVSLDSICYGSLPWKARVAALVDSAVRRKRLVPVHLAGHEKVQHWAEPSVLDAGEVPSAGRVHILSPFDPLVIQRKRLRRFFGYEHRFEAYVPPGQTRAWLFRAAGRGRRGDRRRLRSQGGPQGAQAAGAEWTWLVARRAALKAAIDDQLGRFESFQLG